MNNLKPYIARGFTALAVVFATQALAGPEVNGITTRGPMGVTADTAPTPVRTTPVQPLANVQPMSFEVNYVYRPGGRGELRALTDGAVLRSGDHYKIQFTPEQDGYVYIFQIDSKEAIYRLFPMDSFGSVDVSQHNPVKAGVTYTLPGDDKSFQLDQSKGVESIFFMAFRERNLPLESQYRNLVKALRSRSEQLPLLAANMVNNIRVRGIAAIVDDPKGDTTQVQWDATESFQVPVRRVDNLCADCVTSITFKHR
ncbi:MAG: DUF4384 domain-containing protein [Candidatus Competibacterales bacterium]